MENSSNLEQEIADIERRLAEKKTALRASHEGQEAPSDKEILHSIVKEKIQEASPAGQPPPASPPPAISSPPGSSSTPPSYLSDAFRDQVQALVNLAFTKNLSLAVQEVLKMNNPALLDAFHDVLVDQLYNDLVERGKLPQI